jgi:hypothetical protein
VARTNLQLGLLCKPPFPLSLKLCVLSVQKLQD